MLLVLRVLLLQLLLPLMLLSPPLALPVLPLLLLPSWISNIRVWKRSSRHVPNIAICRQQFFPRSMAEGNWAWDHVAACAE